jgi:DNA-binding phage protein
MATAREAVLDVRDDLLIEMRRVGISRADLARRLGCSRTYVSKLLSRSFNPKLGTLLRVSAALGAQLHIKVTPRS